MKIKDGFDMRDICGEHVIVATGLKNIDFSKVISMNDSAALMWKAVSNREFTVEDMAQVLCNEYEVSSEVALRDAGEIALQWKEIGLVED